MISLALLSILAILFLVYRKYDKDRKYWLRQGIRGPNSPLVFGHYWHLKLPNKETILQLRRWTLEFGKLYGIFEGGRKILVTSDLDMVHEVLMTKFDIFEARKLNAVADEKSSFNEGSILHSTSFRWKKLRNIAGTFFNGINVKRNLPCLKSITHKYVDHLKPFSKNGSKVDIVPILQNLTDDIFVNIIFGDEYSQKHCYFDKMFRAIDAKKNRIEKMFSLVSTIFPCLKSAVNYVNSKLKTNYFFNSQLYEDLYQKVENRKTELKDGSAKTNFTYLDHLLTSELNEEGKEEEEKKDYSCSRKPETRYLMTNEIVSALMNMLYAGHKTSARALTSVVYCLATHPKVQKKLYDEEISQLDEDLTFESVEHLQYLDFVIREALRLYPLGSEHVARKCMATTTLGGGQVKFQPGDFVMVDVLTLHYSDALWGDQADEFIPERWYNFHHRNFTQYLAFGQGPRMCLGEKLAMLKLKVILIELLKVYKIEAVDIEAGQEEKLMHKKMMVKLIPNN